MNVKLEARDGFLYAPVATMGEEARQWYENKPVILLHVYPAGDCDACPFPFAKPEHEERLRSALFDAREMGVIPVVDSVTLPNNERFWI